MSDENLQGNRENTTNSPLHEIFQTDKIGDGTVTELCFNVDDMTPESVGFAIDELRRIGAMEVFYTAVGMKKNRPGVLITCICSEEKRDELVGCIFRYTSTIGIRETLCRRYILKSEEETRQTAFGPIRVKTSVGYGTFKQKAEYEDVAELARKLKMNPEKVLEQLDFRANTY